MKNILYLIEKTGYTFPHLAWHYWCNKNGTELHLSKSYDLDEIGKLLEKGNNVCVVTDHLIPRWDARNFFDKLESGIVAGRKTDDYKNTIEDVEKYGHTAETYVDSRFVIYSSSAYKLVDWMNNIYKKPDNFNVLLNMGIVALNIKVSDESKYVLLDILRKDWHGHNFQTGDTTPFFIKYGEVWNFEEFGDGELGLISQIEMGLKNKYG